MIKSQVTVDWDPNSTIAFVLALIEKHGGTVRRFLAAGPGGGCPCTTLVFPTRASAFRFLREREPSTETDAFLHSQIDRA